MSIEGETLFEENTTKMTLSSFAEECIRARYTPTQYDHYSPWLGEVRGPRGVGDMVNVTILIITDEYTYGEDNGLRGSGSV